MPPGVNSPAIKKAAIQTTGFLVANCCFYVNPTTSSLKQNKDPWIKVEWWPLVQVHYASKGHRALESAPPCFKEDTGGPPGPPSMFRAYLSPYNSSPLSLLLCGWEHSWRQSVLIRDGAEQAQRPRRQKRRRSASVPNLTNK